MLIYYNHVTYSCKCQTDLCVSGVLFTDSVIKGKKKRIFTKKIHMQIIWIADKVDYCRSVIV